MDEFDRMLDDPWWGTVIDEYADELTPAQCRGMRLLAVSLILFYAAAFDRRIVRPISKFWAKKMFILGEWVCEMRACN
eukprot:1929527-Pyramimonas_sp.AAC.1